MLVAHSLISAQLRKSPLGGADGRGHGPVGEAQVLPDQLAGEDLVVAGPVGRQDLRDVHGVVGGLGRFVDLAAGKQPHRPGGQRGRLAFCQPARRFIHWPM